MTGWWFQAPWPHESTIVIAPWNRYRLLLAIRGWSESKNQTFRLVQTSFSCFIMFPYRFFYNWLVVYIYRDFSMNNWLVVEPYPSEKWWSQLGWWTDPNMMGKYWKVIKFIKIPWLQTTKQINSQVTHSKSTVNPPCFPPPDRRPPWFSSAAATGLITRLPCAGTKPRTRIPRPQLGKVDGYKMVVWMVLDGWLQIYLASKLDGYKSIWLVNWMATNLFG